MRKAQAWTAVLAVIGAPLLPAAEAKAESYVFNPRKTEVRFSYAIGFTVQHGRFSQVEGTLRYDERAPERSEVFAKIATASVETGQPIVDDELKGVNFFNSKASPLLTFRSRSVVPVTPNTAKIAGDITVNNITKPVTLDVTLTPYDDPALKHSADNKKFLAKTVISRAAFRMESYPDMVGDEISIEIHAVARPAR
ncbi:MAG: YceI family protein [Hyphomicrobium sp.]|jgi:polyisoprenoid-binding protein YceI|nr:YceI family protein [Hyphomicrobium sp.]